MKSYSSDCYNAGLFTILAVVLKENATGYPAFKSQAIESWKNLGIKESITNEVILKKEDREKIADSLNNEFPKLMEKSYGEEGKLLYEFGFWGGMLFLSVMGNQEQSIRKNVEMLRFKCAELGNPPTILDFIKNCERKISNQEKIDIMEVFKFTEENHYWVKGNYRVKKKESLMNAVISSSLTGIPHIGKALKVIFDKIQE